MADNASITVNIENGTAITTDVIEASTVTANVVTGAKGDQGIQGETGPGVPAGGDTGQALTKADPADFITEWTTIDKMYVGLSDADNTSDLDKPISTATQTALDAKQDVIAYTTEDVANKDTTATLGTSDTKYPSQKAVKTYVDTGLSAKEATIGYTTENVANKDTTTTLGTSDTKYPSQKAVKTYVDTGLGAKQDSLGFTAENTANKGIANGYASLDSGGKVPVGQLPSSLMEYKGTWNATTNSPTLANGTGDNGDVYRVATAGSQNLGSGSISFDVGDYVIYNGSVWEKSDTTDAVASVAGKTGIVTLDKTDVGLSNVDNTSDATKNSATATLTNKSIPILKPDTDATTAVQFTKADGTTNIATVDTTNSRLGILATSGLPTHSLTLGSTATGITLYNTSDQTTNYERVRHYWNSDTYYIATEKGGTGTSRNILLFGGTSGLTLRSAESANGVFELSRSMSTTTGVHTNLIGTFSASSGTQVGLSVKPTLNQSSTAGYTALLINPTETTTGSGAKLLADFQVGGTSKAVIDNGGKLGLLTNAPTHSLTLGSTATGITLYNTSDQTTNYERVLHSWVSNVYTIRTAQGGTGNNRSLAIGAGSSVGTTYATIGPYITQNTASSALTTSYIANNGTMTASTGITQTLFTITPTINQSSTAGYTALLINPTETTTGSGAKLLIDAQVGGTSKFKVDNAGKLTTQASTLNMATSKTPSSATDTGTAGDICWDSSYVYVCTATNTWKRSAIATW